ncbi:LysR family transcriptional regulator [Consotaella salsifontis]|uniref:DNA-binding transcriptional regulator, LysR family n=1 Tax=Consotaella salsifontis TaxID=1365950 RepID=A0A1T4TCB5_9HYPH|nr:LysR family transcriptional regulator [Consotaella salsifontis]SKA38200.1 DNA-binding transcriptional regulator, LysR family [Consotaella salsifontis]
MDLKRLKYFCAIVDHGQISKAAQSLNMAQPPLSLRLKELEEELGVTLIERGGGQWRVTEAGRHLYEKAKAILTEWDDLCEDVKGCGGSPCTIVIGVSSTCAAFLPQPLQKLHRIHPQIKVRVLREDSSNLEAMLRQQVVDVAIMQPPENEAKLILENLPPSRSVAVVPNRLIEAQWPSALKLNHIASHPLLLLRRSSGLGSYDRIIRLAWQRGLHLEICMECPDVQTLCEAWISMGNAIAILPECQCNVEGSAPDGRFIPLDEPNLRFEPTLVRLKGRQLNRETLQFMELVLNNAASVQPPIPVASTTNCVEPVR